MSLYFSKNDILFIHSKLIDDFGGSDGIRDEGILDSAINTPLQTFDSTDLYPTDTDKIARLSFGLVMDHPFIDGNKRIAAKVLDMGPDMNGIFLKATNEEVIEEFLGLTAGKPTIPVSFPWSIRKSDLLKRCILRSGRRCCLPFFTS